MKFLNGLLVAATVAIAVMEMGDLNREVVGMSFDIGLDGTVFVTRNHDLICTF
jgi:hypothetical protein